MKKLTGFAIGFLVLLGYVAHLWFVIPAVPSVHDYSPLYVIMDVNKGIWQGTDEYEFYWDWYGMQTVGIITWSKGPDGVQECAIRVEWTNGLETCLQPPSIADR